MLIKDLAITFQVQLARFFLPRVGGRQEQISSFSPGWLLWKFKAYRGSNWLLPAGILVLVLVHILKVNHNAVYLTLLGFLYTCLFCLWVSTQARLILLGGLLFSVVFTPRVSPLRFIPLEPFQVLQNDEVRTYTFKLFGLPEKVKEFGAFEAQLRIYGKSLKDLVILHSNPVPINMGIDPWRDRDLLTMSFHLDSEESLTVSIKPKPGTSPTIQQGPESHGKALYPDAVFLVLQNKDCRLVYHATPAIAKAPRER